MINFRFCELYLNLNIWLPVTPQAGAASTTASGLPECPPTPPTAEVLAL